MPFHLPLRRCRAGLVVALVLLFAATLHAEPAPGTLRVLASFYPIYIATLNVAHDVPGVTVENLTGPQTGCLHDYQASPRDLKVIASADLFVINGAGMEAFIDKAVRQAPKLTVLDASRGIPLIKGHGADGDNPHVWVSISLAIKQVQNIADGLAKADPAHATQYAKNAAAYIAQLDDLRTRMHAGLKTLKSRDIITFHEAFPYFAQEFDLHLAAVVEREPGSEPSAKELMQTITLVRQSGIKALFVEPQYPTKAADLIARDTGAKVYILDPAVTGPLTRDAYLTIMALNLQTLQAALQ